MIEDNLVPTNPKKKTPTALLMLPFSSLLLCFGLSFFSIAFAQSNAEVRAHIIEEDVVDVVELQQVNDEKFLSTDKAGRAIHASESQFSSPVTQPFSFDTLTKVVSSLLIVICSIFLAAFFYKRFVPSGLTAGDGLQIVESLSIGTRERLVVVEVTGRRFLLSTGAAGTQSIAELDVRDEGLGGSTEKQNLGSAPQTVGSTHQPQRMIVAEKPSSTWRTMLGKRFLHKAKAASEERAKRPYTDVEKLKHYALDSIAAGRS